MNIFYITIFKILSVIYDAFFFNLTLNFFFLHITILKKFFEQSVRYYVPKAFWSKKLSLSVQIFPKYYLLFTAV